MEVDMMARARMENKFQRLCVTVERGQWFIIDVVAVTVADNIICFAGDVQGSSCEVARVLRAAQQSEKLGYGEGLFGLLDKVDGSRVVVGLFEVAEGTTINIKGFGENG